MMAITASNSMREKPARFRAGGRTGQRKRESSSLVKSAIGTVVSPFERNACHSERSGVSAANGTQSKKRSKPGHFSLPKIQAISQTTHGIVCEIPRLRYARLGGLRSARNDMRVFQDGLTVNARLNNGLRLSV